MMRQNHGGDGMVMLKDAFLLTELLGRRGMRPNPSGMFIYAKNL